MKNQRLSKKFLVGIFVVFTMCFWVTTGTLAPYSATVPGDLINHFFDCQYPLNGDHEHFKAVFQFLKGAPKGDWSFSVILRRFVHPLLAYPFMRVLGFEWGGILFNFILNFLAIFLFSKLMLKKFGLNAGRLAALMLATQPGVFYWTGLPYSYAIAVPVFLFALSLLDFLFSGPINLKRFFWISLAMGVLNLGYDVFPYMIFSVFILLVKLKKKRFLPITLLGQVSPLLAVLIFFQVVYKITPGNANSDIYKRILGSYLNIVSDFSGWVQFVLDAPFVFIQNFLDSNFFFLPILFLTVLILGRFAKIFRQEKKIDPIKVFFASLFFVWAFNNFAPPYPGWQMRGAWMARIYQPLIAPMIWLMCECISQIEKKKHMLKTSLVHGLKVSIFVCVFGNLYIIFGPLFFSEFANRRIYAFYAHLPNYSNYKGRETKSGKMPEPGESPFYDNLKKWGRRPLGICPKP